MSVTGRNYEVEIGRITNPSCKAQGWFMRGWYADVEFDSIFSGVELASFEDAEDALLDAILG